MLPWLIVILIAITLVGLAAFILLNYLEKENGPTDPKAQALQAADEAKVKPKPASELKELTHEVNDILTNLSDRSSIVKVSFAFELENKKAKDEFTLLDHKVKSTIIQTLSGMTGEQLQESKGRDQLAADLINKMNGFLQEGKLTHVYVTNFILTEQ
nr:flagellar basal body-associated FliL family protein [Paenibacillus turpanensis]